MPSDAIEPPPDSTLALQMAARDVIDEWGDGDEVDPDRMDRVVDRLRAAVRASRSGPERPPAPPPAPPDRPSSGAVSW